MEEHAAPAVEQPEGGEVGKSNTKLRFLLLLLFPLFFSPALFQPSLPRAEETAPLHTGPTSLSEPSNPDNAAASPAHPASPPAAASPTTRAAPSTGAPPPGPDTVTLDPVIVTAPRIPSEAERVPAAVTVIEKEDIQQGRPTVTLDDALVQAPGVVVSNRFNFAQDLRIAIRGFGARSAFGIRGIQVYVDGIPHTLPDGQSQIDSIDPGFVERIEVMRGPISALYGNSSGGMINIVTQDGPEEPFIETDTVLGEYGLWKSLVKGGGRSGRANGFFGVSRLETGGFRAHSRAESWKMTGKLRCDIDADSDLTLLVDSVYSPELQDPGGLTLQQAQADPGRASPLGLLFDTGETVTGGRWGLLYRGAPASNRNLEAVAYYGLRDLDSAIPFRFVELDREVFGGRIQYDVTGEIPGIPGNDGAADVAGDAGAGGVTHHLFVGVDLQRQDDDRLNFDNREGSPGDTLLLDQNERVTSVGAYLQDDVGLTDTLSVVAGGRYDRVSFEVDDRLASDGDDSGSKTFDQLTGRLGLNYLFRPDLRMYANVAQSFETPTATELVNRPEGGGGINPDIEPQKAVNYEVGLKGTPGGRATTFELALFYIQLEDELIAFRDVTDRVFYRNAGKSRRIGAELGLGMETAEGLKVKLAYTYLNAEFETYVKNGINLEGNRVPGLPTHQVYAEVLYEHPGGFYAGIEALHAGGSYVDDENTLESSAYTVANLRAGYDKPVGNWRISPFVGVENLFDESYSGNVRINASGGRYFEPAPGLNVYGGIGIGYHW